MAGSTFNGSGYGDWKYTKEGLRTRLRTVKRGLKYLEAKGVQFDAIVGMGTSATFLLPLLALVGHHIIMVRKPGETSHGQTIEGSNGPRYEKVVFIDDFTCSGATLKAVDEALAKVGVRIVATVMHSDGIYSKYDSPAWANEERKRTLQEEHFRRSLLQTAPNSEAYFNSSNQGQEGERAIDRAEQLYEESPADGPSCSPLGRAIQNIPTCRGSSDSQVFGSYASPPDGSLSIERERRISISQTMQGVYECTLSNTHKKSVSYLTAKESSYVNDSPRSVYESSL